MLKTRRQPFTLFVLAVFLFPAIGCKAGPAASRGFADELLMTSSPDLPFQKAWRKEGVDFHRFQSVLIAPVNVQYLSQMDLWDEVGSVRTLDQDLHVLREYTEKTFREAFENDPKHTFRVVDSPGPQTFVIEFALTEVVPSKVALKAAGFIPAAGVALKILSGLSKSSAAFEARIRDGATGEIIAQFADRESEKASIVSVKDLTWYSHAKDIIDDWARQFVEYAHRTPGEKIKDSPAFELKPW